MKRITWRDKNTPRSELNLDRNENCDIYLPGVYRDFMSGITTQDMIRYPDIYSAYVNLGQYININPDNLLICNGSEQGLKILLEYLSADCSSIQYWTPTFQMVHVYSEIYKLESDIIPYTYSDQNFHTDLSHKGNDIVYIVNPNNPTGTTVTNEYIRYLCETKKIVIVDEAYYEFNRYQTCIDLVDEYSNLYILRTLSKAHGAAGIRIGYIISQSININNLASLKPAYEISGIGVKFIEYIANNPNIVIDTVERLLQAKQYMEGQYKCLPVSGNYILMEYSIPLYNALWLIGDVKVIRIDGQSFIRVTVTNHEKFK